MSNKNIEELTPTEYFEHVKAKKATMTGERLEQIYANCERLGSKYLFTGQKDHLKKLLYCMETIERQKQLIDLGITTYVSKTDVDDYITNVSKNVVKIIELERYPREIPDEACEVLKKVKDIFDTIYIVYTDYTGKTERKVEQEKKDKDPIMFGVFEDESSGAIINEWYFLCDWVDEYCDLVLEKMISEMKVAKNINIEKQIYVPMTYDELKGMVSATKQTESFNGITQYYVDTPTISTTIESKEFVAEKKSIITTFADRAKKLFKRETK